MITDRIRFDIQRRVQFVSSKSEIGGAIFDALTSSNINWRDITGEEAKLLLVDAMRHFDRTHNPTSLRIAG